MKSDYLFIPETNKHIRTERHIFRLVRPVAGEPTLFSYAPTFINRQISLYKNNVKSKMGIKESQRRQGSLKIMGF